MSKRVKFKGNHSISKFLRPFLINTSTIYDIILLSYSIPHIRLSIIDKINMKTVVQKLSFRLVRQNILKSKHGDTIAPYLFAMFLDYVMRNILY